MATVRGPIPSSEDVLEAEGLVLRPTTPADIPFVCEAESAPENRVFVGQWTPAEHEECVADPDFCHFIVADPDLGEPWGYVVLQGLGDPNLSVLLRRVVIARKGSGIGKRVMRAILVFCFETRGMHRLWLEVREDNAAARRLYDRMGFVQEGVERENVRTDEGWLSSLRLSLLDREYRALEL